MPCNVHDISEFETPIMDSFVPGCTKVSLGKFLNHSVESQDFSVFQILRENNFGESRSSKTAIFAILEVLNFYNLVKISRQKVQKFQSLSTCYI